MVLSSLLVLPFNCAMQTLSICFTLYRVAFVVCCMCVVQSLRIILLGYEFTTSCDIFAPSHRFIFLSVRFRTAPCIATTCTYSWHAQNQATRNECERRQYMQNKPPTFVARAQKYASVCWGVALEWFLASWCCPDLTANLKSECNFTSRLQQGKLTPTFQKHSTLYMHTTHSWVAPSHNSRSSLRDHACVGKVGPRPKHTIRR